MIDNGKPRMDDMMKMKILVICLSVLLIVVAVLAYSYIGESDAVRSVMIKESVQIGQDTCSNFEMRYRPYAGECYECYYPLKNTDGELFNYVYRICYQDDRWNTTLKYAEPLENGK